MNESKEKLPMEFITNFISRGWDEVGALKASIEGLSKDFSGTGDVKKILQDLLDEYLIVIGQLEALLEERKEIPELKEALFELKEADDIEAEECPAEECSEKTEIFTELPDYEVEVEQKGDKIEIELEPKQAEQIEVKPVQVETPVVTVEPKAVAEPFKFFTDFDDPEEDAEAAAMIHAWQNYQNN